MNDIQEDIKEAQFFKGISARAIQDLSSISVPRSYSKRDYLFHEGDEGDGLFLLVEGNIQLHTTNPEGRETVIRIIKPGEVFAEVVLFESRVYPVTAIAVTTSRTLFIPKQGILNLLEQEEFRNDFIAMLIKKQRYLAKRIASLSAYDVESRFRIFLKEHFGAKEQISCELSKRDVASAIGATPETLSRLLLTLKEKNLVSWKGKEIKVEPSFWLEGEA